MDFKVEKGITIIALILTVILMLILAGVGIHFGRDAIDKANLEDIRTDMISIKTRAKIVAEQYNFKDINSLVGSELSSDEIQKLGLIDKKSEHCLKWSSEDLINQGLGTIEGNTYVVYYNLDDPNKCEVYYLKGYQGKYSLTDLQD